MIDNPEKTERLIAKMKANLPLTARLSPGLKTLMRRREPGVALPATCGIIEIFYMGDEGGISCQLDLGKDGSENPFIVSITNLIFDRRCVLFRKLMGIKSTGSRNSKNSRGLAADTYGPVAHHIRVDNTHCADNCGMCIAK